VVVSGAASSTLARALARQRAFGTLEPAARDALAARFEVRGFAAGEPIAEDGSSPAGVCLIVEGEVRLHDAGSGVELRLGEGELFGRAVRPNGRMRWTAIAAGGCTIAMLAPPDVAAACRAHPQLAWFVPCPEPDDGDEAGPDTGAVRADGADEPLPRGGVEPPRPNLVGMPARALVKREPVTLSADATIREAAQLMSAQRVSSVLIVERGYLFGLVTDRDLRNRALAPGLDTGRPVLDIATVAPLTVDARHPAFEALLLMARHNIHHVPVMDGDAVVGMITATDVTEQHGTSPVYLAGDVYRQPDVEGLARVAARVRQLQRQLAAADASAYATGHIVTAITDAITIRLLQLAEARLGPAPVDYAWVAAGSQARSEQTARSDQDNCLVLDDAYREDLHGEYFRQLAHFVNEGLDACGYVFCPGAMMAMTDAWRQPRHRWAQYFARWIGEPEPKALMLTCVFFDLRVVHGNASLLAELRREVLERTRDNGIFLAYMVGNALSHQPPLGLFGNIATIRSGDHRGTVDLKHSGIVPIVDLARVYALAGGHDAVNTDDRLSVAAESREISQQGARDLRDALEFLGKLRIRHQARQIAEGREVDNFLALPELSNLERSHLKDAFAVVRTLQGVLGQRYQAGRF
jgi:CBS domain-containing protein